MTIVEFVRDRCPHLGAGQCKVYRGECRIVMQVPTRCDWLEDRALPRAPPEVLDDYLRRVGKAPPQGALTYGRRVQDLVAMIEEVAPGGFRATKRPAGDLARRRATKVIIEAWLRVEQGVKDLQRVVNRALFLQEEVYKRLAGWCFDAEPLRQEVECKKHVDPSVFTRITFGVWDGEETVNGDACLDAFLEVLGDGNEGLRGPGSREGLVRVAGGASRGPRGVAPEGSPRGPATSKPPGLLARRRDPLHQ